MSLTCYFCEKTFTRYCQLDPHMRTHTLESPYFCEEGCKVEYRFNTALRLHYLAKHKNKSANKPRRNLHFERNCYFCPFNSKDIHKVANHILTHTNEVPYPCPLQKCNKRFKSFAFANKHKLYCEYNPDCSKNRENKTKANRLSKHVCYFCQRVLCNQYNLRAHLKIHTGERRIKCMACTRTFSYEKFMIHKRVCTSRTKFNCQLCGVKRSNRHDLYRHIQAVHTRDQILYFCYFCTMKTAHTNALRQHLFLHTRERPLKCNVCPARFLDRKAKQRHFEVEHSESSRDYKLRKYFRVCCYFCGKMFRTYNSLRFHLVIHTKEKIHKCGKCNTDFLSKVECWPHCR